MISSRIALVILGRALGAVSRLRRRPWSLLPAIHGRKTCSRVRA